MRYLRKLTNIENAEQFSSWRIREALPTQTVPDKENWRLGLMTTLFQLRIDKYREVQDSQKMNAMVDSL